MPVPAIDHMGLSVSDYVAAKRVYVAALEPLGLRPGREYPKSVTGDFDVGMFSPGGQALLIIAGGGKTTPASHLAFRGETRAAVDDFYRAAVANGGRDNGPPGIRTHYHANYCAAFVFDPDGNSIEAITHVPEREASR